MPNLVNIGGFAKDGEIIWEESFGWTDRENQIDPHQPLTSSNIKCST